MTSLWRGVVGLHPAMSWESHRRAALPGLPVRDPRPKRRCGPPGPLQRPGLLLSTRAWALRWASGRCREHRTCATFNVVVERGPDTGLYVGSVPGWPGAHSQGATLDELQQNLREVIEMLLEDGDPVLESEFVGIQTIRVAQS